MVTVDDLRRFERRHGRIPEGSIACMDSGWAAKWSVTLEFKGGAAFPNYHFGFSVEAAMARRAPEGDGHRRRHDQSLTLGTQRCSPSMWTSSRPTATGSRA